MEEARQPLTPPPEGPVRPLVAPLRVMSTVFATLLAVTRRTCPGGGAGVAYPLPGVCLGRACAAASLSRLPDTPVAHTHTAITVACCEAVVVVGASVLRPSRQ
jgi:hypothetical protein